MRVVGPFGVLVVDVRDRFERDGHWNASGHHLAADALAAYMRLHIP